MPQHVYTPRQAPADNIINVLCMLQMIFRRQNKKRCCITVGRRPCPGAAGAESLYKAASEPLAGALCPEAASYRL